MKRRICAWTALLMLVLSMSASAVAWADTPTPRLSFTGTTANCKIDITAPSKTDAVSVTVKLWDGSTCLKTWTQSGTHYLFFSETHSKGIEAGITYKMTVTYSIAGKSYGPLETSASCRG